MEQRQGVGDDVYVPSPQQPRTSSQKASDFSLKSGIVLQGSDRPGPPTSTSGVSVGKPNYLRKSSALYLLCAGNLFAAVCYLGLYEQGVISRAHHEDLKVNLRPPWLPYSCMGSKGVDVTDLQWYYFVVALPPSTPYLVAVLLLSRRLRRYIATRPAAAVAAGTDSAITAVASGVNREAAVMASRGGADGEGKKAQSYSDEGPLSSLPPPHTPLSAPFQQSLLLRRDTTPLHIFHLLSGALIAFCLSGPGFLFGLALMSLNFFCIAPLYKRLSFPACMAIMWISQIAVLYLNFHADGYRFAWFGLSFLDSAWPALIKWNAQYNMTILRMISFNNDLWESAQCGEERRQKSLQKHAQSCIACAVIRDQNRCAAGSLPQEALSCYKCRTECSRAVPEFTFSAYLGYMFYLPLFMAGPLSSFNAYVSYMHYPQRSVVGPSLWRYGLRWLVYAFMLSTLMHYVHVMAMLLTPTGSRAAAAGGTMTRVVEMMTEAVTTFPFSTSTTTTSAVPKASGPPVIDTMTLSQKSVLFFMVLTFLWAKFDVIWRFFRFFALLDGFDPPEDMPRCFANTVNIQSFWRDWHASFNLWIVRYMYIPMGGSRRKFLSIFPIFFFIAIWHDIEMRLLFWALFICIGFIPEIVITTFFASKSNKFVLRVKRHRLLWRPLRVFGTQLCLMELALANLVGFAIGTAGTEKGLRQLFSDMTGTYLVYTPFLFFCAATMAIQDRDQSAYEAAVQKLKYGLQ